MLSSPFYLFQKMTFTAVVETVRMWDKSTGKPLFLHENIKRTKIVEHNISFQEGPKLNTQRADCPRYFTL